ncbi:hypothetical protein KIH27_16215 [Mycobacterium sp. M1]|uniref:Secreted protein n=1 Tax=Mycolicibacter acidiphilus TaxID=2835306 RepID=A0ABS5RNL2_9MYCO|nr:hypothetical protein [Mycolicibacter acidiphilus]MBS9535133.1 hypothetical protein [Mycolicibacter acidiphilus]
MRSQLGTIVAVVLAVSMSGCTGGTEGTQPVGGRHSAGGSSGAGKTGSVRATDPCAGISDCTEITQVDVDGDGAPDRVGITISRQAPPPQVVFGEATIGVLVATGSRVARIDVHSPGMLPGSNASPTPYVGAYRISRKSGADLVFHTQLGQGNSEQFVVVGWSAGQPTPVSQPAEASANLPEATVWYIGSSHGVHEWVTCADGAAVTMIRLSAPTAEGIPIPGGGIREENHFAFEAGAWSPTGSENVADSDFSYNFDPHTQTFQCRDQGAA